MGKGEAAISNKANGKAISLNPVKWYKNLATMKGRQESRAFLIEGDRAIMQVLDNYPDEILEFITVEKPSAAYRNYPVRYVTEDQLRSISSTKTPQGIIAIVKLPQDTYSDNLPENTGDKILLLEDIQDPGNVGALIRTAAAFAFSGIMLTEKCADPFSPKCVQSSAGTILSLWLRRTPRYLESVIALKKAGYHLVAADINGNEDPSVFNRLDKLLLALGNEASGLSKSLLKIADSRLRIPVVSEKAESLNVAACGAICMYLSSENVE